MSQRNASDGRALAMVALVLLSLFGYLQPWIVTSSGSMTLQAYDLAEWASLIPAQRATSPPLLTPLLLRAQPVILSCLLGLLAVGRLRMATSAIAIFLLAAAQLPPFEFVYDVNNLNYSQQFSLAAFSFVAGLALLPVQHQRIMAVLKLALAVAGIAGASLGLSGALALYSQFGLAAAHGAGYWVLSLSYVAMAVTALPGLLTAPRTLS